MRCNYFEAVTCWASAEWSWETCVALGLHYRCAAVHFTVARQRLTLCNQIVCRRVSHCASVMWMGRERVGSRAVRWVVVADQSLVKNKPLAIVTGNGPRHPLLCCCHPPSSQGLSHNITIFLCLAFCLSSCNVFSSESLLIPSTVMIWFCLFLLLTPLLLLHPAPLKHRMFLPPRPPCSSLYSSQLPIIITAKEQATQSLMFSTKTGVRATSRWKRKWTSWNAFAPQTSPREQLKYRDNSPDKSTAASTSYFHFTGFP